MYGSPSFRVSTQELGQVAWVSLLFGLAAFIAKFVELGSGLDWGDLGELWAVAAAALVWLAKRYVTDTRDPDLIFRGSRKN